MSTPQFTFARCAISRVDLTAGKWYHYTVEADGRYQLDDDVGDTRSIAPDNFDDHYIGESIPADGWANSATTACKQAQATAQHTYAVGDEVKLISMNGRETTHGGNPRLTIGKVYTLHGVALNPTLGDPRVTIHNDDGIIWWVETSDLALYCAGSPSAASISGNSGVVLIDDEDDTRPPAKALDEEVFPTYKPEIW